MRYLCESPACAGSLSLTLLLPATHHGVHGLFIKCRMVSLWQSFTTARCLQWSPISYSDTQVSILVTLGCLLHTLLVTIPLLPRNVASPSDSPPPAGSPRLTSVRAGGGSLRSVSRHRLSTGRRANRDRQKDILMSFRFLEAYLAGLRW